MDSKANEEEQKQMKKESEKNKQSLNKVNAYVEDAEITSGACTQVKFNKKLLISKELTQMKKKVASKQIQILDKDVDLIMKEFALSKQESYNLIKKHSGNMKEALIYILNH